MTDTVLAVSGISKSYPGVRANQDISFTVGRGEVHALLGENGAGKSTLVKTIYGLVHPDSGSMSIGGEPYAPANPHAARRSGVAMVFQHFSLFEALSVAENIALGMEDPPPRRELSQRIREVSSAYGLPLDPARLVGDLSVGERQRVEIVRCLLQNPRILIMDEPTSVLTPQEVAILFETLRRLSAEGVAILYISHKLEEIRGLCHRATVLRAGKVVGDCIPSEKTAHELAEMMIGRELARPAPRDFTPGATLLALKALSLPPIGAFGTALKQITLDLRAGEILGVAGVAGNGQDELMLALSGEALANPDAILLKGEPIGRLGPNERRARGLLAAPEERLGHAAAPEMSLAENVLLTAAGRQRLTRHGFIDGKAMRGFAEKIIASFDVRTPGTHVAARALSGGNLQKFVIGREVLQRPEVLIVNQPTWGVDAQAAAAIRGAIRGLADKGAAVLVISQDLDELMEMADSFAVMSEGRMSPPRHVGSVSVEEIGLMMGGVHGGGEAKPEGEAA